jgi:hypothetical protein
VRCELAGPGFSLRLDAASPMPDLGVPTESTPFDRPWANRLARLLSTWRHPRAVSQGLPSLFCLGTSSDGSPKRRHRGTDGVVLAARLRRAGLDASTEAPPPTPPEPSSVSQPTNVASHEPDPPSSSPTRSDPPSWAGGGSGGGLPVTLAAAPPATRAAAQQMTGVGLPRAVNDLRPFSASILQRRPTSR